MPENLDQHNTAFNEEFFQGDVATGIETVRKRLLNLNNTNRLLNFKYPLRPSKQILRIIDASLDIIYRKICDGESLVFNSIRKPSPVANSSQKLKAVSQKANPPLFEINETQKETTTTTFVYGQLPAFESLTPLEFELPRTFSMSDSKREEHQERNYIQVPHSDVELEKILQNLAKTSRAMIEETGVNTLYLVFGFLEWYETGKPETPHLAPLILVPVTLKKGTIDGQSGTHRYFIEYSGEDIDINLTLRERLKQTISLPSLCDDETPEMYFDKLELLIKQQSTWQIRRNITLAMLSFHKFLMWQDLDPSRWPENELLQHPRIKEFFVGTPFEGNFSSEDYQIDHPQIQAELPPLIYDADSSQHSALIDALKGKNLVIEGPPGTGKSQTITNLVAAALAKGKSVLFVAEKQDALNVVHSRLATANLSHFCLELHSNKAKTKTVAESLQQRLAFGNSLFPSTLLASKRQSLEESKRKLSKYVEIISSKFGGCNLTIQQIIGVREKLHCELPSCVKLIESVFIKNAEGLGQTQVEKLQQMAAVYAQHLSNVLRGNHLNSHPWFGVQKQALSLTEERALLGALQIVFESASSIESHIEALKNETQWSFQASDLTFEELAALIGQLPIINAGLRKDLLQPMADVSFRTALHLLNDSLVSYRLLRENLSSHLSVIPDLNASEIKILRSSCLKARQLELGKMTIAEVKRYSEWLGSFANYIPRALKLFNQICVHLNCTLPFDSESASIIAKTLHLLDEAPLNTFHHRNRVLEQDGIENLLSQASQEAEGLQRQAAELSSHIDWNMAPPPELLSRHVTVCANAGLFSFANKQFRLARRDWRSMSKGTRKASVKQMTQDYRSLIQYFDCLKTFAANPQYQAALGSVFNGVKTPFTELSQLARWYSLVRQRLGIGNGLALMVCDALFSAPTLNLKALVEWRKTQEAEIEQFQKVFDSFQSLVSRLPNWLPKDSPTKLDNLADSLKDIAAELNAVVTLFEEFNLVTDLPMSDISSLLDSLEQLFELKTEIQNNRKAASVLGEEMIYPEISFKDILETLAFVELLDESSLPVEIVHWFLANDIEAKLTYLKNSISNICAEFQRLQQARNLFLALGNVHGTAWEPVDIKKAIEQIRSMAESTLKSAPELSSWLCYQRARQELVNSGLASLVQLAEEGNLASTDILPAALFIYQNSLLFEAFRKYPLLERFDGLAQDETRKQFAALDKEVINLTRAEIAWQVSQRSVPRGKDVGAISELTDFGLIRRVISQASPRIKIRPLMERAGKAIQALKPCFMMSPLSLSQFLSPGALSFDLVIMDEASQIRPEDALGAIVRGSQVVIVGDRMQLPPTSFFDRLTSEEEEEEEAKIDVDKEESILHVASQIYQPMRMLKWHYRSRHESLIAFSNKEFYGNQLVVFPSPASDSENVGVKFNFITNGVYNESNQNLIEAEKIVESAIEHLLLHPEESLGIVAINLSQKKLIESLLEKKLEEDELAKQRYTEWGQKEIRVFVKNLESVQGDERDVIFISATAAKNSKGQFLSSLGALNRGKYGHRRLNVLITRARKRIHVFSSIDPSDIKVEPSSTWGLRAFKEYLTYAQTGILDQPRYTGREPDSEFEIVVADELRKRGLEVVPQVGVASYRIDLAIRHPEKPGSYILGVECDGATYHSSPSARDRDRLRQAVLEDLGWSIHRIWSTNWFRNRSRELDKVVERVNALLQA